MQAMGPSAPKGMQQKQRNEVFRIILIFDDSWILN